MVSQSKARMDKVIDFSYNLFFLHDFDLTLRYTPDILNYS